jgi:hypothetical protein
MPEKRVYGASFYDLTPEEQNIIDRERERLEAREKAQNDKIAFTRFSRRSEA